MLWSKTLKSARTGVTDAPFLLGFTHFKICDPIYDIPALFNAQNEESPLSDQRFKSLFHSQSSVGGLYIQSASTTQASTTVFCIRGYVILPSLLVTLAHILSHRSQIKELNQQGTSIFSFAGFGFDLLCSLWSFMIMRMGTGRMRDVGHRTVCVWLNWLRSILSLMELHVDLLHDICNLL